MVHDQGDRRFQLSRRLKGVAKRLAERNGPNGLDLSRPIAVEQVSQIVVHIETQEIRLDGRALFADDPQGVK